MTNVVGVFVYGTLKRGECREGCWPVTPLSIVPGWTRGALYSRHDYPALRAGDDRVLGELWRFASEQLALVVATLDAIEQTGQPGLPDLYDRVSLPVWSLENRSPESHRVVGEAIEFPRLGTALGYRYAIDPATDGFVRLKSNIDGWVSWPPRSKSP